MKRLLWVSVGLAALAIGPALHADEVADLAKKLRDADSDVRRQAAKALADKGTDAKGAVKELTAAVREDKDLFVRRFAAQALAAVGPDAKDAVPALAAAARDDKKELVDAAVTALGKIGTPAVPALIEALKSGSTAPGKGKGAEKKKGGPPASEATDTLRRRKAAEALGEIGAPAKAAVPALIDALNGGGEVRLEATKALGAIGPDAKAALTPLKDMVGDRQLRDQTFRRAAIEAIRKIEQ